MKIKQLQLAERPREKALKYGIESLSNRELIALLIRNGVKGKSALEIADELLATIKDLYHLYDLQLEQCIHIKGLSKIKVIELQCVSELAKRMARSKVEKTVTVNSASVLGEWLNSEIGFKKQEHFVVVFLDIKNCILHYQTVFIGTLTNSVVHPREIFKEAMKYSASKLIVAHNHPSGDVTYSSADRLITQRLIDAGKICGIPVLDHVIVGKNNVFSFRENGVLKFE